MTDKIIQISAVRIERPNKEDCDTLIFGLSELGITYYKWFGSKAWIKEAESPELTFGNKVIEPEEGEDS
jgi:hypothetical protein